jgi:maleylpyruvate isomerase
MIVRLYNYWRSSSSYRVRIALAWKRVPYDYVALNLRAGAQWSDDHVRRSSMGKVPLLEVERDGAVQRVAESIAIIEWIDELYPEPPLLPADPYARARARMLTEMVNSGIQPFQNLSVTKYIKQTGGDPDTWTRHWVGRGIAALETSVNETAGQFSVGDAVSVADLYLVPQLYWARQFGIDLDSAPTLLRIEDRCLALPAFDEARPERQPDAAP